MNWKTRKAKSRKNALAKKAGRASLGRGASRSESNVQSYDKGMRALEALIARFRTVHGL